MLSLCAIVYGEDAWFDRFEKVLVRSLMQPGNLPGLRADGVDTRLQLYTLDHHMDQLQEVVRRTRLEQVVAVEVSCTKPGITLATSTGSEINYKFLDFHIGLCLRQKRKMVLCSPDMFFANGSLSNLARVRTDPGVCLGGMYLRVVEQTFEPALQGVELPMSSEQLGSMALEHLHPSSLDGRVGPAEVNSYYTGFSIQALGGAVYSVSFRTPTLFLLDLRESDQTFIRGFRDFRSFDSIWPSKLADENRLKILSSNDVCFYVELTPVKKGAFLQRGQPNDTYLHQFLSTKILNHLVYALKTDRDVDLDAVAKRVMPLLEMDEPNPTEAP